MVKTAPMKPAPNKRSKWQMTLKWLGVINVNVFLYLDHEECLTMNRDTYIFNI